MEHNEGFVLTTVDSITNFVRRTEFISESNVVRTKP